MSNPSVYNASCTSGRIRLPQITNSTSGSGYVIDTTKFTNNNWVDSDLCYDMCHNGDVPHLDATNGLYYCVAPSNVDGNKASSCLSTDVTMFKATTGSDYSSTITASSGSNATTWTPPPYIQNNTTVTPMCKRPMHGLPSKQTVFDPANITSAIMLDVAKNFT
jgi:hypothetical protein